MKLKHLQKNSKNDALDTQMKHGSAKAKVFS